TAMLRGALAVSPLALLDALPSEDPAHPSRPSLLQPGRRGDRLSRESVRGRFPGGRGPSCTMAAPPTRARMASFETLSAVRDVRRSEEHTSELQSRENAVCRLLLA